MTSTKERGAAPLTGNAAVEHGFAPVEAHDAVAAYAPGAEIGHSRDR